MISQRILSFVYPSFRMLSSSPSPKPFQDIPKAKGFPFFGTALDYRKDKYTFSGVIKKRLAEHGTIYREQMFPGLPEQVVVFRPEDTEAVFRSESEWPNRPDGRQVTQQLFKNSGLPKMGTVFSQGEEWYKMRSPLSKFMMVPRKVAEYHEDFNSITLDLLKNIELKKHPDTAILTDVPRHLFNWSFESTAFFALGKRLGALNTEGGASLESETFIKAVEEMSEGLKEIIFAVPVYRIYPTKQWRCLTEVIRTVYTLGRQFVSKKLAEIEQDNKALEAGSENKAPKKIDLVMYLVHSSKLSTTEVISTVVDLLVAGVETTSYTLDWMLHLLATNSEAQEKLRSEIQRVVGSDQIVTPAHINEMPYLRNILKETQRLYPVSLFNQRVLQKDTLLSGYLVPEGTEVLMPQIVIGRMPELYSEPDKFLPERWDRENKDKLPSMFANLPFGFGPRMCVGRRVAELELHIAVTHLIREYRVECLDKEPMGYVMKSRMLLRPDRPLNLMFKNLI